MSDPFVTFLQIMSAIAFTGIVVGFIYHGYLVWTGRLRLGPPEVPPLPKIAPMAPAGDESERSASLGSAQAWRMKE